MKPAYQTILAVIVGIIVWLSAFGLSLAVFLSPRGHEPPCLCGLVPFVLFGLPMAFFSAGVSTGALLPRSRLLRNLLLALTGLSVCVCAVLAVVGTSFDRVVVAAYGPVCIVGLLLGYGVRRWLIPLFIRRPPTPFSV